jgi:ubiquinone/menaquinone biosynthesis C-methylase UbiE
MKNYFTQTDYMTFARWSHWKFLAPYSLDLYGDYVNPLTSDLKRYQDLLVFSFIRRNVPKGSKILEVGGGQSRILARLSKEYECWNVDKLEGVGNGPKVAQQDNVTLIKSYIGDFSKDIPSSYFDLVFSVSALEHVPESDLQFFTHILDDINRIMRPNGTSIHAFDIVFQNNRIKRMNSFINHVFKNVNTENKYIDPELAIMSEDFYLMGKEAYDKIWKRITNQEMSSFGEPTSINAIWKKSATQ